MNRAAVLAGALLVAAGSILFAWKVLVLGTPIRPAGAENLWQVELEVDVRGSGRRASIRALLPSSDARQLIHDERLVSDRMLFTIRDEDDQRIGVWRGAFEGVRRVNYGFRVQLRGETPRPHLESTDPPPAEIVAKFGPRARGLPAQTEAIRAALEPLDLEASPDVPGRVRTLFGFVSDEIETVDLGSADALLTLAAREGNAEGKAQLLATLLRGAGIPSRLAIGLRMDSPSESHVLVWTQAWVGGTWIPLFPTLARFGSLPADLVFLGTSATLPVETRGVDAADYRFRVVREELRPEEVAAFMTPPSAWLAAVSLYRLPLETQALLRVILVLPLAALLVAVFRNLIGLHTFGTFMPILIALALRATGLGAGLLMVASVLAIGFVSRLLLDRLRLLLVPRLCVLFCLVVLSMVALAILGHSFGTRDLLSGVLFPIVILAMLIERFSITAAEEGYRQALIRLGNSSILAVCAYPLFHSQMAAQLMFGYPELVVVIAGLLVWIGGYTGFRLIELVRFRSLASEPTEGGG